MFTRLPPEPVRLIWCAWLERHGVDPRDVVCDYIERREEACQLAYMGIQRVNVVIPPRITLADIKPPWEIEELEIRSELHKVPVVFQLEAPPLPWPQLPFFERP